MLQKVLEHERDEDHEEQELTPVLADWVYDCYEARRLELLVENDEEARSESWWPFGAFKRIHP